MTTHKYINKICCAAVILALLITGALLNAEALGIQAAEREMGYEKRLFDAEQVHTIDIIIDDWEEFLTTCTSEEYSVCSVVIDGEAYKNVGIRGKGNTSLSTVASMDSDRYSFKIEFDQYDSTENYYGLDKLCLNNIIQDNTYMKDFLVYQMMNEFGVAAPLCSYAYITVNGEDWGLYLAVEGVEEAFLQRNYGVDYGELYKPDSLSMGGGRGNGREFDMDEMMENFDFSQFDGQNFTMPSFGGAAEENSETSEEAGNPWTGGFPGGAMPNGEAPEGMEFPSGGNMPQMPEGEFSGETEFPWDGSMPQMPEGSEFPANGTEPSQSDSNTAEAGREAGASSENKNGFSFDKMPGGFGMGSSDVKLQYIDDNPESYSNIFESAKTDVTETDEARLIASLKALSEGENIEAVVDIEQVIRYFVVHNFVVNGDSYTGSMIHNYYLYEEDGILSMLPWDYNLAFGTFQSADATDSVNDPIDSPVSGDMSDRPMIAWIFESEEYTQLYHKCFEEFISELFDSGKFAELVDNTIELIAPYVEKDPTKFCTYEEFETGAATIREFCLLRAESVSGQLTGTIPSTEDGQNTDSSALVDASEITLSDMGTMNNGGGFGGGRGNSTDKGSFNRGERPGRETTAEGTEGTSEAVPDSSMMPPETDAGNQEMPQPGQNAGNQEMPQPGQSAGNQEVPQQPGQNAGNQEMLQQPGQNAGNQEVPQMPVNMGSMPDMGNFGGSTSAQDKTAAAVLLGASTVTLLFGLFVAFKFKR